MSQIGKVTQNALPKLLAMILILAVAPPAPAYDNPLTPTAIRDAYFLGRRQGGLGREFLADYRHVIPSLRVEEFTSFARIETPFVQVAVKSSRKLNFSRWTKHPDRIRPAEPALTRNSDVNIWAIFGFPHVPISGLS